MSICIWWLSGTSLVMPGSILTLDTILPSLPALLLPAWYRGLIECLIYCHGIAHYIIYNQETDFSAKAVWQWHHAHEFYSMPHHPEADGLIERWGHRVLAEPIPWEVRALAQDTVYALSQQPIYGVISLIDRIHRLRTNEWKWEWPSFYYI